MTTLGTLETLMRYPVKSMRGEALDSVHISYTGLAGDRVFAFVDPTKKACFPWHSAREQPSLLLYQPRFRNAPPNDLLYPNEARFEIDVTTPDGRTFALRDEAFLAELRQKAGSTFALRFSEKGCTTRVPSASSACKRRRG